MVGPIRADGRAAPAKPAPEGEVRPGARRVPEEGRSSQGAPQSSCSSGSRHTAFNSNLQGRECNLNAIVSFKAQKRRGPPVAFANRFGKQPQPVQSKPMRENSF